MNLKKTKTLCIWCVKYEMAIKKIQRPDTKNTQMSQIIYFVMFDYLLDRNHREQQTIGEHATFRKNSSCYCWY